MEQAQEDPGNDGEPANDTDTVNSLIENGTHGKATREVKGQPQNGSSFAIHTGVPTL